MTGLKTGGRSGGDAAPSLCARRSCATPCRIRFPINAEKWVPVPKLPVIRLTRS